MIAPPLGQFGNMSRNMFPDTAFKNFDFSLAKNVVFSERYRLQLRAEFFNIFNHENFAFPNSNVFSSTGKINGSAGHITASNPGSTPRQIQFGLNYNF